MKKTALIFAIIAVSIFLLGILFKLLHWPGTRIILVYGTLFNLVISLPVIAAYLFSKGSTLGKTFAFGAVSAFVWIAGIFFKLVHWPGASILLVAGTAMLIISMIMCAINEMKKEAKTAG